MYANNFNIYANYFTNLNIFYILNEMSPRAL